ncbi:MAG TPA: GIY-YIG nuclease family protein [Candidatus Omnitrophota bacterium]|nr:GIY-YIG nuclease family protein [Candidatus Omnitrophota bacterium]
MIRYFVYILQSKNGKYYTGYTTDLNRRMEQHKTGKGSKFVRGFGFKKLLYHESYNTKSKALKREAELKRWSRSEKETLIYGPSE